MAINKNHEFEELNGVKCGIVEKSASADRAAFLEKLLSANNYTVVIAPSPAPKAAPVAAKTVEGETPAPVAAPPQTFTIGVTDVTFNPINAIFGRQLRTADGHVVTQAYWQQVETPGNEEVPYYERTKV